MHGTATEETHVRVAVSLDDEEEEKIVLDAVNIIAHWTFPMVRQDLLIPCV